MNQRKFDDSKILNTHMRIFLSYIHKFGLQIDYLISSKTKLVWCQLIARVCHLVMVELYSLHSSLSQFTVNIINDNMLALVEWMHTLSAAVSLTRYIHADYNHLITVMFWRAAAYLLRVFEACSNYRSLDSPIASEKSGQRSNASVIQLEIHGLVSKMIHALTVTCPSPDELPSEITRFHQNSLLKTNTSNSLNNIKSLKSDMFALAIQPEIKISLGMNYNSSRLRWIFSGVASLLFIGNMNPYETR